VQICEAGKWVRRGASLSGSPPRAAQFRPSCSFSPERFARPTPEGLSTFVSRTKQAAEYLPIFRRIVASVRFQ
jgi:hypothetical protein